MRFLFCLLPLLSLFHPVLGEDRKPPFLPVLPEYPSKDDFYKPDDDFWKSDDYPPGTILKSRNVLFASMFPNVPSQAKAYQLLYVTQDVHGEKATTVTTIVVPQKPDFNRLLSFQNAYDSPDIDCSPSYGFQNQAKGSAVTWNWAQMFVIADFLIEGPILNIPDYEGSDAAFTVGPQAAYQTLDSIRAAFNATDLTGLSEDANVILFGYSGGGLATEWATEYHAHYAPELNVVGAAMGGLPTHIAKTYQGVNNGTFSELDVLATLGLMNAFPQVEDYVNEHLLPEYRDVFFYPRVRCGPHEGIEEQPALSKYNITTLFDNGDGILEHFEKLLEKVGVMGQHVDKDHHPSFPLYIWQGTNDPVVNPFKDAWALVKTFRRAGTRVKFVPRWGLGHIPALIRGLGPAWKWIGETFDKAEKQALFDTILEDHDEDFLMDDTEEDSIEWSNFGAQRILSDGEAAREHGYEL
ncbi:hypothetical protein ASPWEDRAFT_33447 [Aspergillus wentii DTO 134E9]|uniref:Lipase n=1 Tax=Aspergillus wentii DTO 134E9 TaxID=1073089 RepID=A0A1L9RYU7_ASPWE|nr:uncharacterized protein ASPWEDRAFT_33447 [Aspergillus wentii DTO 134E9]KAI9932555.1 hypothetical protein MW887_008797 [Aspergillus wentii]OJJ40121.1 hypothetical protein ASPWEDRAFT_33447 [Aspergillus wentii DTO 134E9]